MPNKSKSQAHGHLFDDLVHGLDDLYHKVTDFVEHETEKSEIAISGLEKDDEDVITEPRKIASMLMQAADQNTTLAIAFGSRILSYEATIALDIDDDPATTDLSSEYLRKGEYFLISISDPDGIAKIRATPSASIQFPQNNNFNEFYTLMQEEVGGGEQEASSGHDVSPEGTVQAQIFKMNFPDTVFKKKQRRASARFEVPESAMVTLTVERPALITFPALLRNIGDGGLNFIQPADIAPLTEKCHLVVTLHWPPENEIILHGTLVKNLRTLKETNVHVRFAVESYELSRELGELVTYVERFELKARSDKRVDSAEESHHRNSASQQKVSKENPFWLKDGP